MRLSTNNKTIWLVMAVLCVLLESAALFYQYVLNYGPCILCIHVRIIVMGMLIVSLLALWLRQNRYAIVGLSGVMLGLLVFLLERSYLLLGIERRFITGSCGFDSGLPSWFRIDQWFPFMFGIWESCGYTPVLLFGITMAEALIVMSAMLVLFWLYLNIKTIQQNLFNRA